MSAPALTLVPRQEADPRRTLWDLVEDVGNIADLVDQLDRENELTPQLTQQLQEALLTAIAGTKDKVDRTAGVLLMLETMESKASAESERLTNRAAKFKRDRERLELYILAVLDASKLKKIDGNTSTLTKRLNPARLVVHDADAIPREFFRVPEPPPPPEPVPDNAKIKAALKADPTAVPGARLTQSARVIRS